VVENTLQLLILELSEGVLLEASLEEHERQQSARPSKKQTNQKAKPPQAKRANKANRINDNNKQNKGFRSKLPFKCSR
jgi:hypothetical protein